RFDFTKGFGNNIKGPDDPWGSIYDADRIALLKRMSHEIWKRNPEAIVIFEHLADNNEERNLANYGILMWGNLNHAYGEASMGYNAGNNSDFSWISYQERGWNDPHVVGYMESHDEERIMFKNYNWGLSSDDYSTKDTTIALARIQLLTAFFYTIPGPKMIWQFGERGFDYSIDFNGRLGEKPPRWDYMEDWRRNYLFRHVSTLIKLKKEYDVFRTEDFELHLSSGQKKIILRHESMDVVIVGNFGISDHTIDPTFTHTGDWYDYFTGEKLTVENVNDWLLLDPGEYRIYTDVQLPVPDIGTAVDEPSQIEDDNVVLLFPNPTSGTTRLRYRIQDAGYRMIGLFSISGKKVKDIVNEYNLPGSYEVEFDVSELPPGIYIVRSQLGSSTNVNKLIVVK
ncbi:MAG: T9SS type A sorting domain-containing protein, partial [Bacteroidota bacterium]|nr:T9SS type A sorting domain-containing protein [Bacteroidota bacterium]